MGTLYHFSVRSVNITLDRLLATERFFYSTTTVMPRVLDCTFVGADDPGGPFFQALPGITGTACRVVTPYSVTPYSTSAKAWMAVLAWPKSRICWSTPSLMWGMPAASRAFLK